MRILGSHHSVVQPPTARTILSHFRDLPVDARQQVIVNAQSQGYYAKVASLLMLLGGALIACVGLGEVFPDTPTARVAPAPSPLLPAAAITPGLLLAAAGVRKMYRQSVKEDALVDLVQEGCGEAYRGGVKLRDDQPGVRLDNASQSVRRELFADIREKLVEVRENG